MRYLIPFLILLGACAGNCPEPIGENVSSQYRTEIQVAIDAVGADLDPSDLEVYVVEREDMPGGGYPMGRCFSECSRVYLRASVAYPEAVRQTAIHEALHWVAWHEGYETHDHERSWDGWRDALAHAQELYREVNK